jgi:hypothetical protein
MVPPGIFALLLVTVTNSSLVVPTVVAPKLSDVGERTGAVSVPVPDIEIVEGLFLASLLTCKLCEQRPVAVGLKTKPIAQVAGGGVGPTDPLGPRATPLHPSLLICTPQLPAKEMLLTVISTGLGLGLVIVTVLTALV